MNIGKLIKEYREKNGLTQTDFGKIIGVNKQTVSKWEKGQLEPSASKCFEIMKAIDIPYRSALSGLPYSEEQPLIYSHRIKYNVGLNSMCSCVHDYDAFFFFIDAFVGIHTLIEPSSTHIDFLLLDKTFEDKNSYVIPIEFICLDYENLIIEIPDLTLCFTKHDVYKVEKIAFFNNECYAFNVYLVNKEIKFLHIVVGFNLD